MLFVSVFGAEAQNLSNLRSRHLHSTGDTLRLDTLSIVPGTISVFDSQNQPLDSERYKVNHVKALFFFNDTGKIRVQYRVFPFDFSQNYFHKNIETTLRVNVPGKKPTRITYNPRSSDMFGKTELNKQGSISRGISFGNNQDAIVNSQLNLQLSGKLSDKLSIRASMTDQNIPIQPEGNSQQIQDFDKVFIEISAQKTQLTVGDFEIEKPKGFFLKLNKKVQGAQFETLFSPKAQKNWKTAVRAAVAKGKYTRQKIQASEGNQGPYKLLGAEGESYIVVLAASEKVYIDGKLLKRGEQNDYVIDYNMAELTFTPKQPITKDKRIVVEFEYAERNYTRFLLMNSNEFQTKKSHFYLHVFHEQDAKNQPIQQTLSPEEKQILNLTGDSLSQAFVPQADSVNFQPDMVLYRLADTVVNQVAYDSIFVYSTDPQKAHFRVSFSLVGKNKGNYKPVSSSANGRVYLWVAPENGTPQGSYAPLVQLVSPKKKQVIVLGGESLISQSTKANFELAFSNNDLNTFSEKHADDNQGYALKMDILQKILFRDSTRSLLSARLNFRLADKNFDPVERYKPTEFERNWNLTDQNTQKEQLAALNLNWSHHKLGKTLLKSEFLRYGSNYKATKNNLSGKIGNEKYQSEFSASYLGAQNNVSESAFLRHKALLARHFRAFRIGLRQEQEQNRWQKNGNDSLLNQSFNFFQWEVFVDNPDTLKNHFFAFYKNRKDFLPQGKKLKYSSLGQDAGLGLNFRKNPRHRFSILLNYRVLQIADTALSTEKPENTLTGRIEHHFRDKKGVFSSTSLAQTASGLELKREYAYLKVARGQGVYVWKDYNENGIKELDEFEVANFQDEANYIRIFRPGTEYVKIFSNKLNQTFSLNPARVWRKKKGIRKLLSKFSDQLAMRYHQKTTQNTYLPVWLAPLPDSSLVALSSSLRNSLSFQRSSRKFSADYIVQHNRNRMLLTNGLDTRSNRLQALHLRWILFNQLHLSNQLSVGEKSYESAFFPAKNYRIDFQKNKLKMAFQPNLKLEISGEYNFADKTNRLGSEKAQIHDFALKAKYNSVGKGVFHAEIKYIRIGFEGQTGSPVGFVLLEGFSPGDNYSWNLILQRTLSKSLQLNLNYAGRKTGSAPMVHTGGVQLRAMF